MSTTHEPHAAEVETTGATESRRFRWTAEQFDRLAALGLFGSRRVELLEGEIWEKVTTNPPHAIASELVDIALMAAFGPGHRYRSALPLDLGRRSRPEPDFAVLRGSPRDAPGHPTVALLIVEISDSKLRKDRTIKTHVYAQAGIPEYWIVNLVDRRLEVRRSPGPDPSRRGRFRYTEVAIVGSDGHASPLGAPTARVAVADLLP